MDFFNFRNALISLGLQTNGKYELKSGDTIYPTYSVQGLNNAEFAYNTNDYPNASLLDIYQVAFAQYRFYYESQIGKKVDLSSITAIVKYMTDFFNRINNIEYTFEVNIDDMEDTSFEVASDYLNILQFRIDWGDGNIEYTDEDSLSHSYAEKGVYTVNVKLSKVKDFGRVLDCPILNTPIYINNSISTNKCKLIKTTWLCPMFAFNKNFPSALYVAYNGEIPFDVTYEQWQGYEPEIIYIGDSRLPYFDYIDGMEYFETQKAEIVEQVYIQVIGADFSNYAGEYTALKTLKVAPDDLNTFRTAVTAFNNGNTTATLTVLKGKHQDEAYNWATENGHFAAIEKE